MVILKHYCLYFKTNTPNDIYNASITKQMPFDIILPIAHNNINTHLLHILFRFDHSHQSNVMKIMLHNLYLHNNHNY